jgi:hypothetical protein
MGHCGEAVARPRRERPFRADNFFGVIGPTPVELLANDYRAIYTWPQTTKNEAALVALNGRYSMTDHWTVQSNLYYRRFNQEHVDGNAAEVERCSGAAKQNSPGADDVLCRIFGATD